MNEQPTSAANNAQIPIGMRPGRRGFREASLDVSIPKNVPEHMRERVREITHVFVEAGARRKKLATALLNFVCQEADANRLTLVLTARDYDEGGMSEEQLVAWYQRFGFKELQTLPEGVFMARQVHEKPRIKPVTLAVSRALH